MFVSKEITHYAVTLVRTLIGEMQREEELRDQVKQLKNAAELPTEDKASIEEKIKEMEKEKERYALATRHRPI